MKTNQMPKWIWVVFTALIVVILVQGWLIVDARMHLNNRELALVGDQSPGDDKNNPQPQAGNPWSHSGHRPFWEDKDWDPFKEMEQMRARMDDMMKHAWDGFDDNGFADQFDQMGIDFTPSVEVRETKQAYIVTVFVSNEDEANVNTELKDNRLIIKSTSKTEETSKDDQYQRYRHSMSEGNFEQIIPFDEPVDASKMKSDYKDGKLTITVPKKQ